MAENDIWIVPLPNRAWGLRLEDERLVFHTAADQAQAIAVARKFAKRARTSLVILNEFGLLQAQVSYRRREDAGPAKG